MISVKRAKEIAKKRIEERLIKEAIFKIDEKIKENFVNSFSNINIEVSTLSRSSMKHVEELYKKGKWNATVYKTKKETTGIILCIPLDPSDKPTP